MHFVFPGWNWRRREFNRILHGLRVQAGRSTRGARAQPRAVQVDATDMVGMVGMFVLPISAPTLTRFATYPSRRCPFTPRNAIASRRYTRPESLIALSLRQPRICRLRLAAASGISALLETWPSG